MKISLKSRLPYHIRNIHVRRVNDIGNDHINFGKFFLRRGQVYFSRMEKYRQGDMEVAYAGWPAPGKRQVAELQVRNLASWRSMNI